MVKYDTYQYLDHSKLNFVISNAEIPEMMQLETNILSNSTESCTSFQRLTSLLICLCLSEPMMSWSSLFCTILFNVILIFSLKNPSIWC